MSKVYDCCIINNELDMLELRLNILRDVVDYHLIVEAEQTHSGLPKRASVGIALASPRFAEFRDKLIYVCLPDLAGDNSWAREYNHRATIGWILERRANVQDWVIVADVDEIPHPDAVRQVVSTSTQHETGAAQLDLALFYYDFSHRVEMGWSIGMCEWGLQQDANKIRRCEFKERPMTPTAQGWHFSYAMTPEQVAAKLDSFMHHADEGVKDVPRDPAWLKAKMLAGEDIFGRDLTITYVPGDAHLPQYVREHRAKYEALGWLEAEKVATWQD